MNEKGERCSSPKSKTAAKCHGVENDETVQPFPTSGRLVENLGLPLPVLKASIGNTQDRSYSYILSSVKLDEEATTFEQRGSAPNFQGGVLTLCTCNHQMRASQDPEKWKGVWIAGFTSRTIHDGKR